MDSALLKLDFSLALAGQSCGGGAESKFPPVASAGDQEESGNHDESLG